MKHEAGWSPTMDALGAVHWTSPYRARQIVTRPAYRMAGPDPDDEPATPRTRNHEPLPADPPF